MTDEVKLTDEKLAAIEAESTLEALNAARSRLGLRELGMDEFVMARKGEWNPDA